MVCTQPSTMTVDASIGRGASGLAPMASSSGSSRKRWMAERRPSMESVVSNGRWWSWNLMDTVRVLHSFW
eukprot:789991-Pyramimonas_sp.AAC.1